MLGGVIGIEAADKMLGLVLRTVKGSIDGAFQVSTEAETRTHGSTYRAICLEFPHSNQGWRGRRQGKNDRIKSGEGSMHTGFIPEQPVAKIHPSVQQADIPPTHAAPAQASD